MAEFDPYEARRVARELREGTAEKLGSDYYSPREAIDDVRYAIGAGETAVAGAKLVGKSLFNIGKFVGGSLLPDFLETRARMYEQKEDKRYDDL